MSCKIIKKIDTKTVVVSSFFKTTHKTGKIVLSKKKFLCHCDDSSNFAVGQDVKIVSSRPFSKTKSHFIPFL